jgi:hypothetical protein
MIWTIDNETFMISVGWFPNDDVTKFQRLSNCTIGVWYIPY